MSRARPGKRCRLTSLPTPLPKKPQNDIQFALRFVGINLGSLRSIEQGMVLCLVDLDVLFIGDDGRIALKEAS